jgi:glycerol-3-phosphate responsive antiterminator
MLSKKELDDIWETKPYGYFTNLQKDLKAKEKLNKYKVVARLFAIKETELASIEEEVYAKNPDAYQIRDAVYRLQNKLKQSHGYNAKYVTRFEKKLLTYGKK